MKAGRNTRIISKDPRYAETCRIHRDVDAAGVVSYTAEIQEYAWLQKGWPTYDAAMSAVKAETKHREDVVATGAAVLLKDRVDTLIMRRQRLITQVNNLAIEIQTIAETVDDLTTQAANDSVADGDPADLIKNEARMRRALAHYFNDADPWGTVGMRWTPGKDWSKRMPGMQSHVAVGYMDRQPNDDFE